MVMINTLTDEQVSGKVLDHLGLVAATIDKLGLIEQIDDRLPVSQAKGSKVSMGERVAAMILNGLGFMDTRLYMFPEFLETQPPPTKSWWVENLGWKPVVLTH